MSEKQEKRRRALERAKYMKEFDKWLEEEPPMYKIFAWHKWKNSRPVCDLKK